MDDDRLLRGLRNVDDVGEPDPTFLGRLYAAAAAELTFDGTSVIPTERVAGTRPGLRRRPGSRRRWWLGLLAAAVVSSAVGALAVGALRQDDRRPDESTSLFARIQQTGRIRIAIRPDHPQTSGTGVPVDGFDADVAKELARRLGVAEELVIVDVGAMLASDDPGDWDVALPSVATSAVDARHYRPSRPYYYWPQYLVVSLASPATSVADLGSGAVCAVAADSGETWLRGSVGLATPPPIGGPIVTQATDEDCLSMVASGEAVAAVTAQLTDGDLQARGDVRAIGGPAPAPRAAITHEASGSAPDTTELLGAVDRALDEMRSDGTLTRLSQNRFGGSDLSHP